MIWSIYVIIPTYASNNATATISQNNPTWMTLWWNSGIHALSIDIHAGIQDLTIQGLVVKRRGLSTEDTLTGIAAFSKNIKISDSENDNKGESDEAELFFDEPIALSHGEHVSIDLSASIASIQNTPQINNQQFALEVVAFISDKNIAFSRLKWNNFQIGWIDVDQAIFIPEDPESNIRLGRNKTLFEFDLQWDNDGDVYLKFIRFTTNYDELEKDLENIRLLAGNQVISRWIIESEDHLSFLLPSPVFLKENTRMNFSIVADVRSRVSEELVFEIEWNEDIVYIDNTTHIITGIYKVPKNTWPDQAIVSQAQSSRAQQITQAFLKKVDNKYHSLPEKILYLKRVQDILETFKAQNLKYNSIVSQIQEIISKQLETF